MEEDRLLITEYLSGKGDAIEELVLKYQKMVFALIFRMTQDMEKSKDLTQETFVKVIRGLSRFRMESSFKTWIYKIAVNVCLNHLRQHRGDEIDVEKAILKTEAGALSSIVARERTEYVNKAIALLPERQKIAITLRAYEGFSCNETARVMGCSEGAVKAHYHNGVKRLRELMKEIGYDTGS